MNLAKINEQHADTWLRMLVMTTILQSFQYIPIVYSVPYCRSLLYSFIMKHSKRSANILWPGPQAQHPAPHLGQVCHQFRPTCSWRPESSDPEDWMVISMSFECHFCRVFEERHIDTGRANSRSCVRNFLAPWTPLKFDLTISIFNVNAKWISTKHIQ
jgi:hypothetical protein